MDERYLPRDGKACTQLQSPTLLRPPPPYESRHPHAPWGVVFGRAGLMVSQRNLPFSKFRARKPESQRKQFDGQFSVMWSVGKSEHMQLQMQKWSVGQSASWSVGKSEPAAKKGVANATYLRSRSTQPAASPFSKSYQGRSRPPPSGMSYSTCLPCKALLTVREGKTTCPTTTTTTMLMTTMTTPS